MAKSGTIYGKFTGIPTSGERPVIEWSASQSVSGNYSNVTAVLYFVKYNSQYWTYNLNGVNTTITVNGNSSTASRTIDTRSGTKNEIWRRTVRVNHNDNGAKTINIGASGSAGSSLYGTYSFSQNVSLDTIPRATTLSAFSFGSALRNGYKNSISYTVDKKSDSFRNQIQLRDGNTVVFTWDNQNTDDTNTIELSSSQVNTLLNRMSNVTSKSFTLRVATRSGHNGSWIGSAVTRNASVNVDGNVKPSASGIVTSIFGSGRDKAIEKYVQGKTRVTSSFSASAGYGASLTNTNIVVRRVSGSADPQTIDGTSGTTDRTVTLSGSYEAIGTATDSRGRSQTTRTTFTVEAYSPPSITSFTASRKADQQTVVNISASGSHSHLGGSNVLNIEVQKRIGTGAWSNVIPWMSRTATFIKSTTDYNNSVTASYNFRIVLTDQFGERTEAEATVSTQRVVLDIHKDEGVGIGKVHERGVLDIDGDVYSNGILYTVGGLGSIEIPAGADLNNYMNNGFYHNTLNAEVKNIDNVPEYNAFSLLVQRHAGIQQTFTTYGGSSGTNFKQYIRHYYSGSWGPWVRVDGPERGTNSNGEWVRFNDGTQICWVKQLTLTFKSSSYLDATWTFPNRFVDNEDIAIFGTRRAFYGNLDVNRSVFTGNSNDGTHATLRAWSPKGQSFSSELSDEYNVLAIGRWK